MRLSQLRNLLAVVDAGSIQRAARGLGVSQPALSRSIRQLEEELHSKLLERSARGVTPTAQGRAFVTRARAVQNELSRAGDELAHAAGRSQGKVSFGVTPESGMQLMPGALPQFRRDHPLAEVYIVEGLPHALFPRLREGALDFVLGARPQGALEASIEAHSLFRTDRLIAGRRDHPLKKVRSLAELEEAQWLVYAPSGWSTSIIPDFFEQHELPAPKSIVRCESYITLLALIARTDMVGALSSPLLKSKPGSQFFQAFDLKERLPPFAIHFFKRADVPLTPTAAAMMSAVKGAARKIAFSRG